MGARARVGALGVSLCLAGCAAGPKVTSIPNPATPLPIKSGSVIYALPRTHLDARLQLVIERVKPGVLPVPPATCVGAEKPLCLRERALKFEAAAPKADPVLFSSATCRVSLGDATELVALGLPDPAKVYIVEIDPRWHEKLEVNLEWSEGGVPVKSGFTATSSAPGILEKLVPSLGNVFLSRPLVDEPALPIAPKPDELWTVRERTVAELERIAARREQLLYGTASVAGVEAILRELKEREAALRQRCEGQLVKEMVMVSARFSEIGDLAEGSVAADVVVKTEITHPCPPKAGSTLTVHVELAPDPGSVTLAGVAKQIAASESDDAGFRYRTPIRTSARFVDDKRASVLDKTFSIDIAQFGPVGTLPRRLGWRGGAVAATLSPSSGALRGLSVSSGDATAAQIIGVVSTEATRDRELAELERQAKMLELREKIKNLSPPASGSN